MWVFKKLYYLSDTILKWSQDDDFVGEWVDVCVQRGTKCSVKSLLSQILWCDVKYVFSGGGLFLKFCYFEEQAVTSSSQMNPSVPSLSELLKAVKLTQSEMLLFWTQFTMVYGEECYIRLEKGPQIPAKIGRMLMCICFLKVDGELLHF